MGELIGCEQRCTGGSQEPFRLWGDAQSVTNDESSDRPVGFSLRSLEDTGGELTMVNSLFAVVACYAAKKDWSGMTGVSWQ